VALHGGTVGVGDAPEGGALFVVDLPLAAPPGTPVRSDDETGADGFEPPRPDERLLGHPPGSVSVAGDAGAEAPLILVVEDNQDMNRFVCDALSGLFRVRAAFDGMEGLELARVIHPDLIVCDFMMPRMSGDELVRAVRSEPQIDGTPILILTARNDSTARIAVLADGASDYLLKPFYQPELRARVGNLVKIRQSEERLRSLEMAEERDRIARDLHDLVIQRVFAAGMRLSSMLSAVNEENAERLREVVAELDVVISDIRTTIFDLQTGPSGSKGLRSSVKQLAEDAGARLGFQPRLRFAGPVDTTVDPDAATEMLAVLREALSNVIRHARASSVQVELSAGTELVLRVSDDGIGPGDGGAGAGFGLRNMAARAASLGGECSVAPGQPRGTVVEWRVPMTPTAAD
jgi:signal transduction histidine kinase